MYFLGLDIGSSFIKAAILDADTHRVIKTATFPENEMKIHAPHKEWAEQDPETWWNVTKGLLSSMLSGDFSLRNKIKAIGIAYQMHGLVSLDKEMDPVRSSIIWCDSRAAEIGSKAFEAMGKENCLNQLLNSPGNFTASKLKWIMMHEPKSYRKIHKVMLPGDYIALKLTGEANTTISGLSEGIFWDFEKHDVSSDLLNYYDFENDLLADIVPTFGFQGKLKADIAKELGLNLDTQVTYRAGDQPNNAFSLNVNEPGEIAANAGTSGVLYAVGDMKAFDPKSRINSFAHVNYSTEDPRIGQLMCINGTGIANAWVRNYCNREGHSYQEMNRLAAAISPGSEGLYMIPFGNGAERILENKNIGSSIHGLSFTRHNDHHLFRAVQEGVAFSFNYGLEILKKTGIVPKTIKAGNTNMFQSELFCKVLSGLTGLKVELYKTDGSIGAAMGAALGYGYYDSPEDCYRALKKEKEYDPIPQLEEVYKDLYKKWKTILINELNCTKPPA